MHTTPPSSARLPLAVARRSRQATLFVALSGLFLLAACDREASERDDDTDAPGAPAAARPAPATGAAPAAASAAVDPVPAPVTAIGHHAENAYDMAKIGDWPKARATLDSLGRAAGELGAPPAAAPNGAADRTTIAAAVSALDRAVTARARDAAMRAANGLTQVGAELARPYQPRVPADVTLLDYYGRELELWAAAGDVAKLNGTATAMRRTWDTLRPQVVSRGGSAEAERFDSLVTRVSAARAARDYSALATPVLDEVDKLENVFTR